MKVCLDVDYRITGACAAAVVFRDWSDAVASEERVVHISKVEPYVPGEFFRRELPCLLEVLQSLPPMKTVVVDGYVWLEGAKLGLGAHLYQALDERIEVIGIAKTRFQGASSAREVTRGTSSRPLYVSAAGIETDAAAEHARSMHGDFRIPSLIKRVDYLCRHEGSL